MKKVYFLALITLVAATPCLAADKTELPVSSSSYNSLDYSCEISGQYFNGNQPHLVTFARWEGAIPLDTNSKFTQAYAFRAFAVETRNGMRNLSASISHLIQAPQSSRRGGLCRALISLEDKTDFPSAGNVPSVVSFFEPPILKNSTCVPTPLIKGQTFSQQASSILVGNDLKIALLCDFTPLSH